MDLSKTVRRLSPVPLALCAITVTGLFSAPALANSYLGTPGGDVLIGRGSQPHVFDGDGGRDRILGGAGPDRINGGPGGDRLEGRDGDDHIDGFSGDDKISGGAGADTIVGDFGRDTITGDAGDDSIEAGGAGDRAHGGAGNDTINGGGGIDTITGGEGDDVLNPGTGPDAIDAGPGDDVVQQNNHQKIGSVDCGPGQDTIILTPPRQPGGYSHSVALKDGRVVGCESVVYADSVVDPTLGVKRNAYRPEGERIIGTDLNDQLTGASGPDHLSSGLGDDVLWGNRLPTGPSHGTDTLDSGPGADRVFAGRGHNVISAGDGDDYVAAGPRRNRIDAGAGNDTIRFHAMHRGPSTLATGPGDDIVHAYGRGPIRIACGPGDDTVRISFNRLVRTAHDCEHVTRRYKG